MLFLRLLKESLQFAADSLNSNRLRTFLSLLGITIGIFAIISVFTIVDYIENSIREDIESLGDNVIYIQKWPWAGGPNEPWWKYRQRPYPELSELEQLQRETHIASAAAFMAATGTTVKYDNSSIESISLVAVSHDYDKIKTFEIKEGRYFSENESHIGRNVAIIGSNIAEGLFGNRAPLGKKIKVMGREMSVIGIFEKEGDSMLNNSADNQVVIPVNFARTIMDINSRRYNPFIMVKARAGISNEDLITELQGIMRSVRKLKPKEDDNFALNEVSLLSSGLEELFALIGTAGLFIGGFAILVGGFGIANIMFVSVRERTAIIGIQKSLGAKNYFILLQFLAESVFLCLIGGGIGLIMIFFGTLITNEIMEISMTLTLSNIILGITISTLIGIISGFIPAYSASQLNPVEAIRTGG